MRGQGLVSKAARVFWRAGEEGGPAPTPRVPIGPTNLVVYEPERAVCVDEQVLCMPVVLAGQQVKDGSAHSLQETGLKEGSRRVQGGRCVCAKKPVCHPCGQLPACC